MHGRWLRCAARAVMSMLGSPVAHAAFNGLAPIPQSTLSKIVRNIGETKAALAEGK